MFTKIKERVEDLIEDTQARDDERQTCIEELRSDDDVARGTEWGPANIGGASFKTHKLFMITSDRLAFKKTVANNAVLFSSIAVGIGMFLLGIGVFIADDPDGLPLALCGIALVGLTFAIYRYTNKPIVFDLSQGLFWIALHRDRTT